MAAPRKAYGLQTRRGRRGGRALVELHNASLPACLVLSLSFCSCFSLLCGVLVGRAAAQVDGNGGGDSSSVSDEPVSFTIVHVNDIHGRVLPSDRNFQTCAITGAASQFDFCYGGYPRIAAAVAAARAAGPTLVLNVGDEFTGTLFSVYYQGRESWTFLNAIGFDAMTLGDHDFDKGPNVLRDYAGNLTVPITTCNVAPKPSSVLYGKIKPGPLIVNLTVPDGAGGSRVVRVGLVGWTTPTTPDISSPGPDIEFLPLVPSVTACVDQLKEAGVDIIIGLGHAGIATGNNPNVDNDYTVAQYVPGLDIVLGGHSHTFMYNGTTPLLNASRSTSGDVASFPYPYGIQAAYDADVQVPYLGKVTVTFDAAGELTAVDPSSNPILLGGAGSSSPVADDETLLATAIALNGPLDELSTSAVGSSLVALTRPSGEQNLGNLICDVMVWEVKTNLGSFESRYGPVNICFENSGGIRTNLAAGNLTIGNVLSVLPFGNVISIKSFNGSQLLGALNRSINGGGGFMQLAGLSIVFDGSLPQGSRTLLDAKLLNSSTGCLQPIDPAATYNFISNDFTARGGDASTEIGEAQYLLATGRVLADVVSDYIARFSPVAPKIEGRIQNVSTAAYTPRPTCAVSDTCSLTPTSYTCTTNSSSGLVSFTIVHVNDIHGRVLPSDRNFQSCAITGAASQFDFCYGGYPRIAAAVAAARAAGPTLVLNVGDEFTGTLFSVYYQGRESWTFLNAIGFDAMTLGDHDFDKGPNVLKDYAGNLTVPITTCNIAPKPSSVLYGKIKPGPLIVNLTVPDGAGGSRVVRVGLVGWTTPATPDISSPGPDIEFLPLVPSVTACVDQLKEAGVDIIIGLGHAGIATGNDPNVDNDYTVVQNVPGLDIVLGGHSHTFMYNGTTPLLNASRSTSGDVASFPYPYGIQAAYDADVQVPYVQAFWGSRYLGKVTVTFDATGELTAVDPSSNPILLGGAGSSSLVADDETLLATAIALSGPLDELSRSTVGSSLVSLTRPFGEQNLGNLICDAMVWEVKTNLGSFESRYGPVNICFENSGGIRTNLAAGNVTIGNVLSVLPFGNVISIKSFNGSQLLGALNRSINGGGGFMQLAGLSIVFDGSLPQGSRKLLDAKMLNPSTGCLQPIDPAATYNFISNDFTARGGDASTEIGDAQYLLATGRVLADVVSDYIARFSPVAPEIEGRIQNVLSSTYAPRPTCAPADTCLLTPTTYTCVPAQSPSLPETSRPPLPSPPSSSPTPPALSPPPLTPTRLPPPNPNPSARASPPPLQRSPPLSRSPPPKAGSPAPKKTPPPVQKSPPPVKKSPPLVQKSPPPVKKSPPPVKKSPPSVKKSPPPVKKSPPPVKKSPPPVKKSPPPIRRNPPPWKV